MMENCSAIPKHTQYIQPTFNGGDERVYIKGVSQGGGTNSTTLNY
jgi:hypothetical protein